MIGEIALSVALVIVAALAWDGWRRHTKAADALRIAWAHQEVKLAAEKLRLERDRFEATKPVAPHEDLVARVQALEDQIAAVKLAAGVTTVTPIGRYG